MNIKKAQKLILENLNYNPKSQAEVLGILNEEAGATIKALMSGNSKQVKEKLEDVLSCVFLAFDEFNIDIDSAINHKLTRLSGDNLKTMHIFSDRIEIHEKDEIRAKWAIWSVEDLKDAEKMARDFNCQIIWEREEQLSLFNES